MLYCVWLFMKWMDFGWDWKENEFRKLQTILAKQNNFLDLIYIEVFLKNSNRL